MRRQADLIFDTHTHLIEQVFEGEHDYIFSSIMGSIECAAKAADFEHIRKLKKKYSNSYAAFGIHPQSASEYSSVVEDTLTKASASGEIIAIGEIGLDYYFPDKEKQLYTFVSQVRIAEEYNLPVIIHCRKAMQDVLSVLKNKSICSVYHGFSGSKESAETLLKRDFFLGIGTALLFSNVRRLTEAVKHIPLERILLETDSPYMSADSNNVNSPLNIRFVAEKIAEIKGVCTEEILLQNIANIKKVFKIEVKDGSLP